MNMNEYNIVKMSETITDSLSGCVDTYIDKSYPISDL